MDMIWRLYRLLAFSWQFFFWGGGVGGVGGRGGGYKMKCMIAVPPSFDEAVPLVGFMHHVFTCMPGDSGLCCLVILFERLLPPFVKFMGFFCFFILIFIFYWKLFCFLGYFLGFIFILLLWLHWFPFLRDFCVMVVFFVAVFQGQGGLFSLLFKKKKISLFKDFFPFLRLNFTSASTFFFYAGSKPLLGESSCISLTVVFNFPAIWGNLIIASRAW